MKTVDYFGLSLNPNPSDDPLPHRPQHEGMDHSQMDHSQMDHSQVGHNMPGHRGMDHSQMDHSQMDHSQMGHNMPGHQGMDHSQMDHSQMGHDMHHGHEGMNHSMQMVSLDSGESVMIMGGMPPWLFVMAAAAIIVLSFIAVEKLGVGDAEKKPFRFNLIRRKRVYRFVKNRWFQAIPQFILVGIFALLIYAGLFGSRVGNIAPVAVWTLWWGGLVFAIACMGPLFCFACPWDGLSNLLTRFRVARIQSLSLQLPVPKSLQNMYPAIALFAFLTWAELGLGVTQDPRATAYMGIGMAVLAIACALTFSKKAFCAHLCPVGRISGIYGNFSPVEVRARNPRACRTCVTEDCLHGNDKGYPCPTGISLKVVNEATNCTWCTECVKSCPRHNVAINIRPFAADLGKSVVHRWDESWMCIILLALTLFHGFSMTTIWENFLPGSQSLMRWMLIDLGTPKVFNFSVGMIGVCLIPIALFVASCKAAEWLVASSKVSAQQLFRAFSFSLLPVALFYHLAHNSMHLLMEGGAIVPMLSDPLGRGDDFFGTANLRIGHLFSDTTIWYIQIALILIGHFVGIVVAHKISRKLFAVKRQATLSLIPMLIVMVVISVAGLSLMVMDMNMRVGRM